jgi:hypothetical protein
MYKSHAPTGTMETGMVFARRGDLERIGRYDER